MLRFVGPTDHIYSCSFVQMLEQRLENAYDEAQDKVLETYNRLTVEVRHGFMQAIFTATSHSQACHICMQHANQADVNNNKAPGKILDTYNIITFYTHCGHTAAAPQSESFTANEHIKHRKLHCNLSIKDHKSQTGLVAIYT